MSVALLSMEGQKALIFHQKVLNLCSEDEPKSYGFGPEFLFLGEPFKAHIGGLR